MAESYIRAAEDELSCPICFELFVDPNTPKTLSACGHVCCVVCLKKMAAGKCDKKCPECRKIVNIPKDGVTSFLTNFRLRTLADNHLKIADGQSLIVGQTAKPTGSTCPIHKDEKMRLYCATCNVLICQLCMIQKHNGTGHNIDGVKAKYRRQKVELRSAIEEAGRDIQNAKDIKQKLQTHVKLEHQSRAEAEKEIDDCKETYMNKVHEQSQSLKCQLRQASEKKMSALQQKIAAVDEEIQSAESSHRDAANALENRPDYEYVTQHTSLVDKMKRLRLEGRMSRIRTTPYAATRFEKEISQDILLGKIMPDGQARVTESIRTKPHAITRFIQGIAQDITLGRFVATQKLALIQTLDGFERANNTSYSADGLLLAVCDFTGKKLLIYRKASNGQYKNSSILHLRLTNHYGPTDVAICSDGRFLVARGTVEVYTPEGNYWKNITTKSDAALNVRSVITISNGRILAGDIVRSVITEHDPTGNIMRTIKTNIQPFYITLIQDTHIAMSDWKSGKVSVMDIESGQETLSIDIPMVNGICYDEQTDCLLTVRNKPDISIPGRVLPNTGVIEKYCCSTGMLVACLAKGLYLPQGIGFSSDGILAVPDRKTVKVYTIQ